MIHLVQIHRALRRERVFRDRFDPIDSMREDLFVLRYRLPKFICLQLCNTILSHLEPITNDNFALSSSIQLCVALRFFSQGCYLSSVGDIHHLSNTSASRCVENVTRALAAAIDQFVLFPPINNVMQDFYAHCNLPQIIGAIDGTHIKIVKPNNTEHAYINRKGWHSINVMLVCGTNLSIYNCVARFPGANHDAFILNSSSLADHLEQQFKGYLLGDSGYPAKTWLLTPITNPQNVQEERYNRRHVHGRNVIERCNGLLKQRFRCLHGELHYRPEKACAIINACVVLHNLAIANNIPEPDNVCPFNEDTVDEPPCLNNNNAAITARQRYVNKL